MNKFKTMNYKTILAVSILLSIYSEVSIADCVGSGSIKSCYDLNTGNSYTVSELGNSTYVTGSNARTGNIWSQTSTRLGNTTYTNGIDSEGNPWNSTTTHIGNTVHQSGFDSDGNPFSNTIIQQDVEPSYSDDPLDVDDPDDDY